MFDNNKMRAVRAARGLSQNQLSRLTGIRQAKISEIESGRVVPREHEIALIREALDWTEAVDRALDALEVAS